MPQCSVPLCTNQGGHQFPKKDPELRKRWIIAIRREDPHKKGRNWEPGKQAKVCQAHFAESDYKKTASDTYFGITPTNRILKPNAVPSLNLGKEHPSTSTRDLRAQKRAKQEDDWEMERDMAYMNVCGEMEVATESLENPTEGTPNVMPSEPISIAIQTEGTNMNQLYSAKNLNDESIRIYTGLESYAKFVFVLQTLGEAAYDLNYFYNLTPPISVEDQFLLTLMKLRVHPTNKELKVMFGITEKQVSNIFITWINFMFCQWGEIDWWPSRELVRYYAPSDFHLKFPATRCIFDGTEFPIKKPKQPVAQQATFSTYKNRNTMKILVGATPGGLVSYVSEAYAGSTSDRQIVERSKIPQMCDPGDDIMADKGFNVEDLFIPYHVKVNIPTFFKKKNRMSNKIVRKDRTIASKRVHIERVIGLAKTYKILCHPMTPMESSLSTRISSVIFTLCNFRSNIVPCTA